MSIQQAVEELRGRGYNVCRILPGEKLPGYAGWSARTLEAADFKDGDSVGIVCGPISESLSLVCVDLDSPDAITRADEFLPATGMIDGRAGKPRSHRWYLVRNDTIPPEYRSTAAQAAPAAITRYGHAGPQTRHGFKDSDGKTAIDFQGTGALAVVPPSIHASGQRREWEGAPGSPAESDYYPLLLAVCKLADAIGCTVPNFKDHSEPQQQPRQLATDQHGAEQKYAAALEAAIHADGLPRTGKGGDVTTFRLLAYGLSNFALEPDRVLSTFCRIINEPLKAVNDAWDEAELRRKIDTILKRGVKAPQQASQLPPMRWDDARRLASTLPSIDAIRFIGNAAFEYTGKRYMELPEVNVRDAMRRHAERCAERNFINASKRYTEAVEAAEKRITELKGQLDAVRHDAAQVEVVAKLLKETQVRRDNIRQPPQVVETVSAACVANAVESLRAARALPPRTAFNVALSCLTCPPRNWLACANGILDLESFTLHQHTPDWFSPVLVPVAYDPAAIAPQFTDMLAKITCGDAEIAAVLQEVVGACLDPWCRVQFFAMLVGDGKNGKSTFLTVLRALLGEENVSGVDLQSLSRSNFMAYQLLGKLANISGEAAYFESEDTSKLKRLTGGDVFEFEAKNKQPIASVNTAKLIAGCNELPRLRDRSEGLWRRAVLVPFNWRVPDGKQNPAVLKAEYWQAELSGVLNWALEGLKRLRQRGEFALPATCKALLHEHRLDSNPARRFLAEHYRETREAADVVIACKLFEAYRCWAAENGIRHEIASNTFGKEVRRVFPGASDGVKKVEGKAARVWCGLKKVTLNDAGSDAALRPLQETNGKTAEAVTSLAFA